MKYQIKQKAFSMGKDYLIQDENQNSIFLVDGEAFSWGNNLSFQDMEGNELGYIKQSLSLFNPKYEIYKGGKLFADVVKEFSWFDKKFTLDVPGPNDYTIDGSFWDYEYNFTRNGNLVASVSKSYFSWTDTYGVDIANDEDYISILSTVIVIDLVCHENK